MTIDVKWSELGKINASEERILKKYHSAIENYAVMFMKFGAICKIQLRWKNTLSGILYDDRPAVSEGYASFVTCEVHNADGRIIESLDHDMYMDFAWQIAGYTGEEENAVIRMNDDIEEDLFSEMDSCLRYFNDPY